MGCGCNDTNNTSGGCGCGGGITKMVVLAYEDVKWLLKQFSGKICTVWGSLNLKATAPLKLEKTADGTVTTLVGSVDTATEESLGVVKPISGNGLKLNDGSEDETKKGELTMGLATQTEAGAMSATDKTKLDSLSTDVATEEKNGLMSKEDKAALDALTSDVKVEFDNPRILFTNDLSSTTVTAQAYMGGATVPIDEWEGLMLESGDFGNCASASAKLSGGVIQVTITRKTLLKPMSGSLRLVNVVVGGKAYGPELVVSSADNAITVLQGQVMPNYPEDDQLEATLWTFDGAKPTVRFSRKGAYWVNLPSIWQSALGDFHTTRLNVQVTMGGKGDGSIVYCGRFSPGKDYNGDKASTDCWAAVLVLMRDISNEAVDAGFYITVSYVPSVGEYICTKEEEQAEEGEHTVDYGELTAELSYPAKEHDETSVYPEYSYSQKWTKDGVEQEPLTTGGNVKFELVENYNPDYYDVSVNENTGEINAPRHVSSDGTAFDSSIDLMLCRVKMTVTLNNVSAEATADVVAKGIADTGGVLG